MAVTLPAAADLAANKPGKSSDWLLMRTAISELDGRAEALEDAGLRVFSHFSSRIGYTSATATFDDLIIDGTFIDEAFYEGNKFYITNNGGAGAITNEIGQSATADTHYLRIEGSTEGHIIATASMLYNRGTSLLPITFIARIRQSDNTNFFHYGLINWITGASLDNPASTLPTDPYIIMNRNNATDMWRFSSYDGTTTTHGSDFAKTAINTWFEVKIVFTDDPSTSALCYVDDVLKQTLSANLPTATILYGHVAHTTGADTMDLDRMEVSAAGVLSDSA